MKTQNQIRRKLAQPFVIERINHLVEVKEVSNRNQLALRLCEELELFDARGQSQRDSCLETLRVMEGTGLIQLPEVEHEGGRGWSPRRLGEEVAAPKGVPRKAGAIRALELVEVVEEGQMRIWNELMLREHPQGHRPMMGRQLRYLIGSEHGWLGAVGFGAAALGLRARDEWIGWDYATRREHLDQVVCMSRFLIRNAVRCENLASMVLGKVVSQMPKDFERRYGYRPLLLESFVDTSAYTGCCYKASNWIHVGETQGRGRQDRDKASPESIKAIYLYPLRKDFRRELGLDPDAGGGALNVTEGLEGPQWAANEMGSAPLGDARLSQRLVSIAQAKGEAPGESWLQIIQSDRAAEKGFYRLIDHPNHTLVSMESMLQPHRQRTLRRMSRQSRVLCIQDQTDLNYSTLKECKGLGIIGTNQTRTQSKGLRLHSTLVVTQSGLPLGVLRADCFAPQLDSPSPDKDCRYIPIEEKKTYRWIEGLQDCMEVSHQLPGTSMLCVMDREADFFELFDHWRENPCVDLLVRAKHDRRTQGQESLFTSIRKSPLRMHISVAVPRASARPKKGKKPARKKRPARRATVEVRYATVQIHPPSWGLNSHKEPVDVQLIHLLEPDPPAGQKPIEWFLLSTLDLQSLQCVEDAIRWYCLRWRIEDWHRVLKSGCRAEKHAHRSAQRLRRALAIDLVIAWRIMLMNLLGRQQPDLPAELLFTQLELKVLAYHAKKNASPLPTTSAQPSSSWPVSAAT